MWCAANKQTKCYRSNTTRVPSTSFLGQLRSLPKAVTAEERISRQAVGKSVAVPGGVFLNEKILQPIASDDQLTTIAHNKVLALKQREILAHPRP